MKLRWSVIALLLCATAFAQDGDVWQKETKRNEELAAEVEKWAARTNERKAEADVKAKRLEVANQRYGELTEAYRDGGTAVPTEDKVLQEIRELEDQTARTQTLRRLDELQRRRDDAESVRDDSARWLVDLSREMATLRESNPARDWAALETRRRELLTNRRNQAATVARALVDLKDAEEHLNTVRRKTLFLLRRENLFLRGRSEITEESFSRGWRDIRHLPGWLAETGRSIGAYAAGRMSIGAFLRLAAALLAVFGVFLLASRWVGRRADAAPNPFLPVVARILRALAIGSVLFLAPLLVAELLPDIPARVRAWLRILAYTLGGYWLARNLYQELFLVRPPATEPIVKLEPHVRRRLGLGVRMLLLISVIVVPSLYAVELFGYSNRGMIELGWLVYEAVVAAIVLTTLLRRSLFQGILPSDDSSAARLLEFVVRYIRPLALILVPAILVFDALRFDILAGLLTRYSVAALVVLVGGSLVYRFVVYLIEVTMRAVYKTEKNEKRAAAEGALLFVWRIAFLLLALSLFLRVSGSEMVELRSWLSASVPLTSVTWWSVILGLFYLTLFLVGTHHAKNVLQELVLDRTRLDRGVQYTITTLVGYLLVFAGFYLGVKQVFDLSNIGYIFAALSVGIGFGLQEIVSNFVSGLILLFERPLKVGDLIQVGDKEGIVKQINIRATTVLTRDNVYLLVPNREFIAQTVTNFRHKDPKIRIHVTMGVSYASDTRKVESILLEVAKNHSKVLKWPEPEVWFREFGDSSLNFEMLVWILDPPMRQKISSELMFEIFDAFAREGIEIPFPQRDLHLRSGWPPPSPEENAMPDDAAPDDADQDDAAKDDAAKNDGAGAKDSGKSNA